MNTEEAQTVEMDVPADWRPEMYPTTDREWLEASYLSTPMGVAVSILVADPLEEDAETPVYPLAVTTDASEVVYKRQYDIFAVATSIEEAREQIEMVMSDLSAAFASGRSDFILSAIDESHTTPLHISTRSMEESLV